MIRKRILDLLAGVAVLATLTWILVTLLEWVNGRNSYPGVMAQRFLGISLASFGIAIGISAAHRLRVNFPITRHWSAVVCGLAFYEFVFFVLVLRASAGWASTISPIVQMALEVFVPSLIAALMWWAILGARTVRRLFLLFILSAALCIVGALVTSPALLVGIAEEEGLLPKPSVAHMTGIHTPPFPRHLSYLIFASLAGLPAYFRSKPDSEISKKLSGQPEERIRMAPGQ